MSERPGVVISWLFPTDVSGWFAKSLADLLLHDAKGAGHMLDDKSGFIALSSGPRVAEARNTVIDHFAAHYPETEWLLMLDSDMTFDPDILDRLLEAADPVEAPIVGGLCFAGGRTSAPYPTIYRQVPKGDYVTIARVEDYPRDAMVKVGATGGACLLMHRRALAALEAKFGRDEKGVAMPYPWFAEGVVGPEGEPWGEDIIFCLRANSIGIPVHVHTGVKLGHVKTHIIDEVYYDNMRREMDLDRLTKAATGEVPVVEDDERPSAMPAYGANRAERRRRAREKARAG